MQNTYTFIMRSNERHLDENEEILGWCDAKHAWPFPANEGLLREATSVALKEKAAVFLSADFVSLVLQGSPAKPLSYFRYLFQSIKTIFHHHIFIQSSIDQFWGSLKLGFKYWYWYFEENHFSSNLWSWPSWLKKEGICIPNKVYYRHFLVANTS